MLPNSDLDIGIVFNHDTDEVFKERIRLKFKSLPFDKIDIASWSTIEEMIGRNKVNTIETNKAIDTEFSGGSIEIAEDYLTNVRNPDHLFDKRRRMITEFGILRCFDYISKVTEYGPNLKYDFGASRDIVFLDWYYLLRSGEPTYENPFYLGGLEALLKESHISEQEKNFLQQSIELILTVKFSLVYESKKVGKKICSI